MEMTKRTLENVAPVDIDTSDHFWDTFATSEKETIARNIVLIAKKENSWKGFSWEAYKSACSHRVTSSEKAVLDQLVREGYLSFDGEMYKPKDRFVQVLHKYIKS